MTPRALFLLLALLLIAGCGTEKPSPKVVVQTTEPFALPVEKIEPVPVPLPPGWIRFKPNEGAISVPLPGEPRMERSLPQVPVLGQPQMARPARQPQIFYVYRSATGLTYTIRVATFSQPPQRNEEVRALEGTLRETVRTRGKSVSEQYRRIKGCTALECWMPENEMTHIRVLGIIRGRFAYVLSVSGSEAEVRSVDAERFFDLIEFL